jgi:hypothetical protein
MSIRDDIQTHYGPGSPTLSLLLDTYRDEVLAEADLLPKADVVAWLTKKAREDTPVENLASKVDRGAIRPNNLRMLPATFFEPGRTYSSGTWKFRCETITASPGTGERRALGWKFAPVYGVHNWHPSALDPDDWTHGAWTEATEDGAK